MRITGPTPSEEQQAKCDREDARSTDFGAEQFQSDQTPRVLQFGDDRCFNRDGSEPLMVRRSREQLMLDSKRALGDSAGGVDDAPGASALHQARLQTEDQRGGAAPVASLNEGGGDRQLHGDAAMDFFDSDDGGDDAEEVEPLSQPRRACNPADRVRQRLRQDAAPFDFSEQREVRSRAVNAQ